MDKPANMYPKDFLPMLTEVSFNTNQLSPGDEWWITAIWQNTGKDTADTKYKCMIELEMGEQRRQDGKMLDYVLSMDSVPGFEALEYSEITGMSAHWPINFEWNGTHHVYLSIVDENKNRMPFIGQNGKLVYRQHAGDIDSGWGWGKALMLYTRQPYSATINASLPVTKKSLPDTVAISDGQRLKITMSKSAPVITEVASDKKIYPQPMYPLSLSFRDFKNDFVFYTGHPDVECRYSVSRCSSSMIVYHAEAAYKGERIVSFDLAFSVKGNQLKIEKQNAVEAEGFEFLNITIPSILTISDDSATLVDMWEGGRLIHVQKSRPMSVVREYDIRNALGLHNDVDAFVYEGYSLDDDMIVSVSGGGEKNAGTVGAVITNRVRAYNHIPSVQTPQSSVVLDLIDEAYGQPDWIAISKFLRKDIKRKNFHIYSKRMCTMCYCAYGPEAHPQYLTPDAPYEIWRHADGYTFKELPALMSELHNLSDGYGMILWVYGYFKQDNGQYINEYSPYEEDVKRAGTHEEFRELIRTSKEKYNIVLCMYENYDDWYDNKGFIDPKYIAMNKYGEPFKGWYWDNGQSYIVGSKRYFESGEMKKRADTMAEIYLQRDTEYIDVISSEVKRVDFSPDCPCSAQESLYYRRKIIELNNDNGIDVFSEQLTHPFVGHQGYALHHKNAPENIELFYGSELIPMMMSVYHGTIGYNSIYPEYSSASTDIFYADNDRKKTLKNFKYAGYVQYEFAPGMRPRNWVSFAYLYDMPMRMLENEYFVDYRKDGETDIYEFTNNSFVIVNEKSEEYTIVYNGVTYAKNFTALIPGTKPDTMLAYSKNGGELRYEMPEVFKGHSSIKAVELCIGGPGDTVIDAIVDGNALVIDLPADKPFRVYKA